MSFSPARNEADASLFVPARFGIGWTVNWSRRATWAIVVASALVTIAFIAGCVVLL